MTTESGALADVQEATAIGPPAISATGLTRVFGDFTAVSDLDLEVPKGELFSLLGPNGAGKTTTIKMLCCLLRPTAGSARIFGHDVSTEPLEAKQRLAISPQETAISEHLNARENLALMSGLHGLERRAAKTRIDELLELMGLTGRADERVKKYSGCMQRRLSIAMALVSDPEVLFLDEPTLGLDPQARRAMWEHIAALKDDTTIVLTTHYLEEADALADRIGIIDEGKLIALGSPDELKRSISDGEPMVLELEPLSPQAIEAVRSVYPSATAVDGLIEIRNVDVDLFAIQDVLRPLKVAVKSSTRKTVTLDDVFIHLTGKQLRE